MKKLKQSSKKLLYVSAENVRKLKQCGYKPKQVDNQLNNVLVSDLETFDGVKHAIRNAVAFSLVSKILTTRNRNLTS